jgi:hypothetical protein
MRGCRDTVSAFVLRVLFHALVRLAGVHLGVYLCSMPRVATCCTHQWCMFIVSSIVWATLY